MIHNSFTESPLSFLERVLRGRDDAFFRLLVESVDNAAAAAQALERLLAGYPDQAEELAGEIRGLEHRGDQITHEIIRRLNREVATPIDREDILELASALDDITDFIDESADCLCLYRAEATMVQANAMAHVLADATGELTQAVRRAVVFQPIASHTVEVHRLENEGDRLVRRAIASLFIDGIDPLVVIRWKDIFGRIEDAIDATEHAAFVLESIVIKNI